MSPKQWLGEIAEVGISVLRGLTFPSAVRAPDGNSYGLLMVFSAMAGALYAFVLNGYLGTRISPFDLSGLTVFVITGLLAVFWLSSKVFLKLTKSTKSLVLNLVESHLSIWFITLSMLFIVGIGEVNPFGEADSHDGLSKHLVLARVCFLIATTASFVFWLIRFLLKTLDDDYFEKNAVSGRHVWWLFGASQIAISFITCYILLALPFVTYSNGG